MNVGLGPGMAFPAGMPMHAGLFDGFGGPAYPDMPAQAGQRGGHKNKKRQEDDDANYTTVMLRNIPNKYTRQMLIDQLHCAGFRGDIDYLYLPTDFANRCNVGYCFLNFRTAATRARFIEAFDSVAAQTCLPGFNSYKVCQVTKAKWQGADENIRRLRSGPELMAQLAAHPEWLPLLLDEEGNQEPFLCDDGLTAARGPAAPRRPMRKARNQVAAGGIPGMAAEGGGLADPFTGGHPMMLGGGRGGGRAGGGKGGGGMGGIDGGRGRQRRGGGKGAAGGGPGMMAGGGGMMMQASMMGEGMQYMPYDGHEGNYFFPYPGAMGADGMPFGAMQGRWGEGMPAYGAAAFGGGYPGAYGGYPGAGAYGGGGAAYDSFMAGAYGRPGGGKGGAGRGGMYGGQAAAYQAAAYQDDDDDDDDQLDGL